MGANHRAISQRIAWLEGVRIFAAVMILVYHAQLLITNYAYTPQPTGLMANWRSLLLATETLGSHPPLLIVSLPGWFGFQFVDVFVLLSGFSLVLSLKGKPLQTGQFLKQRCLRILVPLWTVAWLSYPILWLLGSWTQSYIPSLWHFFAAATFPLLFDYAGGLLLPVSGPWWFISLVLSLTLIFPLLWERLQQWGARNLLLVSAGITLIYRTLAIYAFGGHPTYIILDTLSDWFPFLTFLSKLSSFTVGMVVAQAYLQNRGPVFWKPRTALLTGAILYLLGFISQFYTPGWIIADMLTPLGLTLCCMTISMQLEQVTGAKPLTWLGARSYSYFLIHNFVVDRTLALSTQDTSRFYLLTLPLLVIGTLLLSMLTDWFIPYLKQTTATLWRKLDRALTPSSIMTINYHQQSLKSAISSLERPSTSIPR